MGKTLTKGPRVSYQAQNKRNAQRPWLRRGAPLNVGLQIFADTYPLLIFWCNLVEDLEKGRISFQMFQIVLKTLPEEWQIIP